MENHDSGIALSPSYRQLNDEFRFEWKRLQTFQNWPVDAPIEAGRIAKAGFYYTGNRFEVQCFACKGKIQSWNYGDQAIVRHRQMNPSCPFVLQRSSNVPLNANPPPVFEWLELPSFQLDQASPTNSSSVLPEQHNQLLHIPFVNRRGSSPEESHSEGYGSDYTRSHTPHTPSELNFITQEGSSTPLPEDPLLEDVHTPDHTITTASVQSSPQAHPSSPIRASSSRNPSPSFLSHHDWTLLKREDVRLRTFDERFTATFLSPLCLAQAGFFYLGMGDQVQCAFCRGVIGDWEVDDDPRQEHERLFPTCPFILNLPVGNVSLGEQPPDHSVLERTGSLPAGSSHGFDVVPQRFTPQYRPNAIPDSGTSNNNNDQLDALLGENLEEVGITKHRGPQYPMFATFGSRMNTFTHWPSHLKQTPQLMSQAGFFYLGANDHVKCFHCDGGLRNWETDDDPWMEHARWFPRCRFVNLIKGEKYIKEVAESKPAQLSSSRTRSNPPPLPLSCSPPQTPREATEEELRELLDSPIAQTVLNMGVDISRVKQALKLKIRATGRPFSSVDLLLEAAIEVQHHSEHRQSMENQSYEAIQWPASPRPTRSSLDIRESSPDLNMEVVSREASVELQDNNFDEAMTVTENKAGSCESRVVTAVTQETPSLSEDRTKVLEEEIRRLKEARLCKVCLDEDVSVAYLPCGHLVTCAQCAAALENCPLCRKNIKGTVRIFFT